MFPLFFVNVSVTHVVILQPASIVPLFSDSISPKILQLTLFTDVNTSVIFLSSVVSQSISIDPDNIILSIHHIYLFQSQSHE